VMETNTSAYPLRLTGELSQRLRGDAVPRTPGR